MKSSAILMLYILFSTSCAITKPPIAGDPCDFSPEDKENISRAETFYSQQDYFQAVVLATIYEEKYAHCPRVDSLLYSSYCRVQGDDELRKSLDDYVYKIEQSYRRERVKKLYESISCNN